MAPPLSGLSGGSETEGRDLYHICAFGDGLSCEACALRRELICRDLRGERRLFVLSQVPFFLLSFFGMGAVGVATGVWWPIFAYSAAGMAFLGPGEMALLCRHCPHYARVGPRLRCIGPNPFPKLFSPRLQPMSGLEKGFLLLFIASLLLFPIAVQAYGACFFFAEGWEWGLLGMALAALGTAVAALHLLRVLTRHFCLRCVNFSCPLNRVQDDVVERYLEMNPAMGAAWKEGGS